MLDPLSWLGWVLVALLRRLAGPLPEVDDEALAAAVHETAARMGLDPRCPEADRA